MGPNMSGGDEEAMVVDEAYLRALELGLPPNAGRSRVDIDTLVADEARQTLHLRARWWLTDVTPTAAPANAMADISIELPDRSVDTLAAAHRLAIWRLAQRITGTP